jgi:hypothetical protein
MPIIGEIRVGDRLSTMRAVGKLRLAETPGAVKFPQTAFSCSTCAGEVVHLHDTTGNLDVGMRTITRRTDCVGLVVQTRTNTQIVLGFGSGYNTHGWVLNSGDAYTLSVFTTTVTGTVKY